MIETNSLKNIFKNLSISQADGGMLSFDEVQLNEHILK
jgi:hypothetical protein